MITTIIFDIDGVVATFDFPSILKEFERCTGITATEATNAFDRNKEELLLGHMSVEQFFSELSKNNPQATLGLVNKWVQIGIKHVTLNQDIINLIRKLKRRYSIGILSNASSLRRMIDACLEFYAEFDFTLFSCDEGVKKPDPNFFQIALDKASSKPSEAIFIDDKERYVSSAVALGMHGVVYSNNEDLVRELATLLPT